MAPGRACWRVAFANLRQSTPSTPRGTSGVQGTASIGRASSWRVVAAKNAAKTVICPAKKQADAADKLLTMRGGQDTGVARTGGDGWEARIRSMPAPRLVKTFEPEADA